MFKLLIFEVRYSIEARYSIPHGSMNPIHEFRPFQNMAVISLKSVSAQQSGAAAPIVQFIPSAAWAIAGNPACARVKRCFDAVSLFMRRLNAQMSGSHCKMGISWSSC